MNSIVMRICAALCAIFGSLAGTAMAAVTLEEIANIRSKSVLREDTDMSTIDAFIEEQFAVMMRAQTLATAETPRQNLLANLASTSTTPSTRQSYSDRFAQALQAAGGDVFQRVREMPAGPLTRQLKLSTAIVMASTDNPLLIEDLLNLLKDDATDVRYWALRGLTTPTVQEYISTSEPDSETVQNITQEIDKALPKESSGSVIAKMAQVSAALKDPQAAVTLLQSCIQRRADQYRSWQVDQESSDLTILNRVFELVSSGAFADDEAGHQIRGNVVHDAARLLSLAYFRYRMGTTYTAEDGSVSVLLSEKAMNDLRTLLIEGELGFYGITGNSGQQSRFKRGLSKSDDLPNQYKTVLGVNGVVDRVFHIFPEDATTGFEPLPEPPEELVEKAANLTSLPEILLEDE